MSDEIIKARSELRHLLERNRAFADLAQVYECGGERVPECLLKEWMNCGEEIRKVRRKVETMLDQPKAQKAVGAERIIITCDCGIEHCEDLKHLQENKHMETTLHCQTCGAIRVRVRNA